MAHHIGWRFLFEVAHEERAIVTLLKNDQAHANTIIVLRGSSAAEKATNLQTDATIWANSIIDLDSSIGALSTDVEDL